MKRYLGYHAGKHKKGWSRKGRSIGDGEDLPALRLARASCVHRAGLLDHGIWMWLVELGVVGAIAPRNGVMTLNGALTVTRTKSPGRHDRGSPVGPVGTASVTSTQANTGVPIEGTMLDCVATVIAPKPKPGERYRVDMIVRQGGNECGREFDEGPLTKKSVLTRLAVELTEKK